MKDSPLKLSLAYRILRKIGLNYSEEEYGQVSLWQVICKAFSNPYHALMNHMMDWVIFEPIAPRMMRPWLLRRMGATKVGKGVFIGDHCRFDQNHVDLITINDHAHITSGTRLLCHQRDLSGYRMGDDYAKLPYKLAPIFIGRGACICMESMVMPGVHIGDGAIVEAASLVAKDIPAWTIAVGNPAKPVRHIQPKEITLSYLNSLRTGIYLLSRKEECRA